MAYSDNVDNCSIIWEYFWLLIATPSMWWFLSFAILVVLLRSFDITKILSVIGVFGILMIGLQTLPYYFFKSTMLNSLVCAIGMVFVYFGLIIRHKWTSLTLMSWIVFVSFALLYQGRLTLSAIGINMSIGLAFGLLSYVLYLYVMSLFAESRKFFSDTYTSTGVLKDDASLIPMALSCTLLYAFFRSLLHAI